MEFFCLKCREKKEVMQEQISSEDRSGKTLFRSKCPSCSTSMAKFGKKS